LLASASAFLTGRKWNVLDSATEAVRDAIPVLGILMGVGMFIQIMTLTGVRGFVVVSALAIPAWLLYLSISVSVPAFGAISSFGAASVLGVPFILALLSKNQIMVASGLALISGWGILCPLRRLPGFFAAQVVGGEGLFRRVEAVHHSGPCHCGLGYLYYRMGQSFGGPFSALGGYFYGVDDFSVQRHFGVGIGFDGSLLPD
jgi:hypothetical protein